MVYMVYYKFISLFFLSVLILQDYINDADGKLYILMNIYIKKGKEKNIYLVALLMLTESYISLLISCIVFRSIIIGMLCL
jgi:hypothetical protein